MNLPHLSIRRPVLTSMMSLALVLFGVISLARLPVREMPDIDPPIVSVTTIYPGANAAVVETEVTERLEEAVNDIEGIRTLNSQSREQVSGITIEFDLSRDIDLAAQDVRDRVSRVRGRLPKAIEEPVVAKQDADAWPILWIELTSDRYSPLELTSLAEKQIKNRLQTVRGVSSIMMAGEQRFAIRLWLDTEKMAARQVTVLDIERALREQNVELPSGRVENLHRQMNIETRGELKTPDEFNRLVVKNDGTRFVRLEDVGEACEGVEDEHTTSRSNGQPCIFLGIIKQSRANTVEVARGIEREIDRILPMLPEGVRMATNFDESVYVERAMTQVWETLGLAFLLVILVIFLFLGDLRSTVIAAVAIPVSILGTFTILHWMGYSVNILTMLALVLAIGIVVDDAIVVVENISRHIQQGTPPLQAAFKAMEEIRFAVIAITVALVAVFLPLAFLENTTGRLFVEFAVALVGSVIISAFVALSLSPMMAARILKPAEDRRHSLVIRAFGRLLDFVNQAYQRLLEWSLGHRLTVLACGLASLFLTILAYRGLEKEFLIEEDKGLLLCLVVAPQGATSEFTDRMVREVEEILRKTPEVQSYGAMVAPAFGGPGESNNGFVLVRLKDKRKRSVQDLVHGPGGLQSQFFNQVEGAWAIPQIPKVIARGISAPFQLVIQAQDLVVLERYVTELDNKLRQSGYLQNVRPSYEVNKPELRLDIDRDRASTLGVSIEDVSRTLQILFGGLDLSRIKKDGKEHKVIAQLRRSSRLRPQDIDQVYIRSATGQLIQLNSVVSRQIGSGPNAIEHYNRLRSATITATPVGMPLGTAMSRVERLLKDDLPSGFLFEWAGESRDLREASKQIWWVLALALLIVYMVLASQFESLVHPFTVMLAVPLAAVGAFGLLWLLNSGGKIGLVPVIPGSNINLFSQIGLFLLIGLVTKNSILLVEFANQLCAQGLDAHTAMIRAGVVRLRPILMTAFSTIVGILPIAIGFGIGAESRRPMGIVVVGGMLTSTLLTLVIVPVVYTVFSELVERMRPRRLL